MTAILERAEALDVRIPTQRQRWSPAGLSILGPVALVGLLFVYPLITVIRQTFQTRLGLPAGAEAWKLVLPSVEFHQALITTVELAVGATVGCVLLGTFIAVTLALVVFPGSAVIARLTTLILAFPSFFIALSFTVLYGRVGVLSAVIDRLTGAPEALGGFVHTFWAVLLAEITFYTPFVIRPVYAACQQMQISQLQVAASLGARPARVLRQILLPELLPSVVAGASLCLMLTLNEFGIVLFIGAKDVSTLPVLIYTKGIVSFDYPSAAVIACVQVALSLLLYGLGRVAVARLGRRRAGLE
jgi:2-aminoethylphosphonate transport system permease protein